MKYTIQKESEVDGVWYRAYSELGHYIPDTLSRNLEQCEKSLRFSVSDKPPSETVKELEI